MNEIVVVPTYRRNEFLHCCLRRLREIDADVPILVFPDHGTWKDEQLIDICNEFEAHVVHVPDHHYYGNSYNALESLRFGYNSGADLIFYVEDDVMVRADFFDWHRRVHDDYSDIFGAMAWIFNRHAPIEDGDLFQPWYYAIGTSFKRDKLEKIIEHATPLYYEEMQTYILRRFSHVKANTPFGIAHYEQDGIIQRVLLEDGSQVVCPGIARCSHVGTLGYNQGWDKEDDFFYGCETFEGRVKRVESFIADAYWRANVFGKDIVNREIGRELIERKFKYRLKLPGGWETDFESELTQPCLPRKIRSVVLPPDAEIVVRSD